MKFILLPLDQSTGTVLLAETSLEIIPVNNLNGLLKCLSGFPPSSCRPGEVVGGLEDFLIVANRSNFQVVLNCAKPIIGFQWVSSLGKGGWIGLLKVTQSRPLISTFIVAIVVIGAKVSGKLMQGSEVSLALLHNETKQLGSGKFRWWWRVSVRSAATSAYHLGLSRIIRGKAKRFLPGGNAQVTSWLFLTCCKFSQKIWQTTHSQQKYHTKFITT